MTKILERCGKFLGLSEQSEPNTMIVKGGQLPFDAVGFRTTYLCGKDGVKPNISGSV